MKNISRGWLFVFTEKPTQWVAFQCKNCGFTSTYPSNISDDKSCPRCDSEQYNKIGYIHRIREVQR